MVNKYEEIAKSRIGMKILCYKIVDVVHENGKWQYVCRCCECGKEKIYEWAKLCRLKTNKCLHTSKYGNKSSGRGDWSDKRLCKIYHGMLARCYDEKAVHKNWKYYGGKGIKVCDEWMDNPASFEEWALSHGYRDGLTIDRIDSDKDYCPENCRWVTLLENTIRASAVFITVNNETHTHKQNGVKF